MQGQSSKPIHTPFKYLEKIQSCIIALTIHLHHSGHNATIIKTNIRLISIGITKYTMYISDKIIIELNTSLPSFEGLHDIIEPINPPNRLPYLICRVDDRAGSPYVRVDTDKIVAIIESTMPDNGRSFSEQDDNSEAIANDIIDFFQFEVKHCRLPKKLLPLQSGVDSTANAVIGGLAHGPFSGLNVWTEVLQDTMLDFLDSGKLDFASTVSLSFSVEGFKRFYSNWDKTAAR
jgi:acetyl-CoA hydrolase